jgi:hypothetical protein
MAETKGETLPFPDIRELMKGVPTDGKDWHVVAFLRRSPQLNICASKRRILIWQETDAAYRRLGLWLSGRSPIPHQRFVIGLRNFLSSFIHTLKKSVSQSQEPFRRPTTALCGQSCQYIALKDNEHFSSPFSSGKMRPSISAQCPSTNGSFVMS